MGSLTYDGIVVQFEDRVLTHLQIVIVQKLRKGESFLMSWRDADSVGDPFHSNTHESERGSS